MAYADVVDFAHPIEALIPGAQGKILAALARITGPVTLRALAKVAAVSPAQCSRLLGPLVELGIVDRVEVPPAAQFSLVRAHIAARPLLELLESRERLLAELSGAASRIRPAAASIVVFGSLARGAAGRRSDIDVLMVRSGTVDPDDVTWRDGVALWVARAERTSGNPVNVVEVSEREARRLLRSREGMWASIREEGIGVQGAEPDELIGGARAPRRSNPKRVAGRRPHVSRKG